MIENEKNHWSFKSPEYHTMTVFLRKCFFTLSIHKFISWKYVGIQQVEFNVATMHKLSVKMFISWNSWSMWVNLSFEEKKHRRKCAKYKNNERFLSWENNYLQSWDGWLYIGLGRVRFQGEVEVSFDSRIQCTWHIVVSPYFGHLCLVSDGFR